jgi:hypothetical protein
LDSKDIIWVKPVSFHLALELHSNSPACYRHIKLLDNIAVVDLEFAFKAISQPLLGCSSDRVVNIVKLIFSLALGV